MNKLFCILAICLLSCTTPREEKHARTIRDLRSIGMVNDWQEVKSFHDDERDTTCYVVTNYYETNPISISCVKDFHPNF